MSKKEKYDFLQILKNYQTRNGNCRYPNCKNIAILSHTISKNQLKQISSDGQLYHIRRDLFMKGANVHNNEGIQKFSTFYGFCNYHDDNL